MAHSSVGQPSLGEYLRAADVIGVKFSMDGLKSVTVMRGRDITFAVMMGLDEELDDMTIESLNRRLKWQSPIWPSAD